MLNLWRDKDAGKAEIEQLVYLSNLIGSDSALVQPGGGNTSVKLEEEDVFGRRITALVVKGSGTDLRSITAAGFTHLYVDRLALLREEQSMSDEEMMALMRACMLYADWDPLPSVETPLHSLLLYRFVAHTHDVATLSLTDTPHAEKNVRRVFGDEVAFLEYARPGFPLSKRLVALYKDGPPKGAIALVMEKHGLAVWGETAKECYENLRAVIDRAEAFVAEQSGGKKIFGPATAPAFDEERRREIAAEIMPAIRGELARNGWRAVLHLDDSPETLDIIAGEFFQAVALRGVMTPEHILRAGVKPLCVKLDLRQDVGARHATNSEQATNEDEATDPAEAVEIARASPLHRHARAVRRAIQSHRAEYSAYAERHRQAEPLPDFLKTIVIPGVGIVYAGKDRCSALVAADCYRASMQVMAGAEAVERFEFLSEADACEMEYWPLERRKIEESAKSGRDLDGKIALVVGAASGIGRATALRFADEGAHVVLADLDADGADILAREINERQPERALALRLDVSDAEATAGAIRDTVLHFGGLDVLFYSPGVAPVLHSVADMPEEEIERQIAVHFRGAVAATREAAKAMLAQGAGGRLVYNASKAAFVPGEGAAAYGASKAALVHYVRNVAAELGKHGITANYINADAVDTPLFRSLVRQRAEQQGKTEEEMLELYAQRSVLGQARVPSEAVAEAALWLASERAAYTTGCVITVGGGAEGFPR
jgi:rhamnose utilization protein RhaD (predicted bifunctional aldolase and dehydrogenase)/NAD(P)-dependent dehydrogenase (short-subunit alcohol dehydrogenase family)